MKNTKFLGAGILVVLLVSALVPTFTSAIGGRTPVITGLYLRAGAVGDTVHIYGYNFTPTNNYVRFASLELPLGYTTMTKSSDGTQITIKVPAYIYDIHTGNPIKVKPGYYEIYLFNTGGLSNGVGFKVVKQIIRN